MNYIFFSHQFFLLKNKKTKKETSEAADRFKIVVFNLSKYLTLEFIKTKINLFSH